jgi:pimeloyl-ACP methyl ester carboxylesterase
MTADTLRNVVLVHGGFVDGSGWQGVHESLTRDGFRVSIVQNPTLSLEGDAAATRWVLDAQDGPAVLVGHSYGGAVVTEAGAHPNVAALVYVAAFVPDKGESVGSLIAGFPADGPQPPILPPRDGFLLLDRDKFHASFAGDLPAGQAAFMADAQVPWNVAAPAAAVTEPAWRSKPSWYLLTTQDRMIPPPAQRTMADRIGANVTEVAASHSVYVSQPEAVATLIAQAAAGYATAAS